MLLSGLLSVRFCIYALYAYWNDRAIWLKFQYISENARLNTGSDSKNSSDSLKHIHASSYMKILEYNEPNNAL